MTTVEFLRARWDEDAEFEAGTGELAAKRLILELVDLVWDNGAMARLNLAICYWAARYSAHEDYDPSWAPELWEGVVSSERVIAQYRWERPPPATRSWWGRRQWRRIWRGDKRES
jgi:hypothetical protein